ncbi:MAG: menaquinone biosynthesis decarboxylase [Clostridia bacterium]|nr:menaquinone biosynthesis decarboxylase [Clostridia bacterium]
MAYSGLRAFLSALEKRGELTRIRAEVSPELEITEITDRVSKAHGRALLFERAEGSPYPVAINVMGSYERMALALGAETLDDIAGDVETYLDFGNYTSLPRLVKFAPKLLRLLCCFPLRRPRFPKRAPCQQVIERDVDLGKLPVLRCWPLDGGRFMTLPLVFTKYPDSGAQNVGMYRMQVLGRAAAAMHWHKHKDGSAIYESWRKKGGRMPVSVALGGDPALAFAATAPLPSKLDEMMLAGFLRKKPVSMVKCVTNELYVPAGAEFVLEGYVNTDEDLCWEGPFGDHTGYYSLEDWYPKFHVTCVTHRRNPVYPATVVGRPPMEDCYMAKATERIFLPILRMQMPQLVNLNLPMSGGFHNCAILSVRPDFPGAARTVMNAVWGMGQMRYTKLIVTVDAGVDPYDTDAVLSAVLTHADFSRDILLDRGPLDALDHSSDEALHGTRIGVDATPKAGQTGTAGALLVLPVDKNAPRDGLKAGVQALEETDAKLILAVDASVHVNDPGEVWWRVFNNIDGGRDLIVRDGRAVLDATRKLPGEGLTRPWPEDIVMSDEIKRRVDRRWEEYGL